MEPLAEAEELTRTGSKASASLSAALENLARKLDSVRLRQSELRSARASKIDTLATNLRAAELNMELANLAICRRTAQQQYQKTVIAYEALVAAIDIAPVLQCSLD
jgi:hypothetical protein